MFVSIVNAYSCYKSKHAQTWQRILKIASFGVKIDGVNNSHVVKRAHCALNIANKTKFEGRECIQLDDR